MEALRRENFKANQLKDIQTANLKRQHDNAIEKGLDLNNLQHA